VCRGVCGVSTILRPALEVAFRDAPPGTSAATEFALENWHLLCSEGFSRGVKVGWQISTHLHRRPRLIGFAQLRPSLMTRVRNLFGGPWLEDGAFHMLSSLLSGLVAQRLPGCLCARGARGRHCGAGRRSRLSTYPTSSFGALPRRGLPLRLPSRRLSWLVAQRLLGCFCARGARATHCGAGRGSRRSANPTSSFGARPRWGPLLRHPSR